MLAIRVTLFISFLLCTTFVQARLRDQEGFVPDSSCDNKNYIKSENQTILSQYRDQDVTGNIQNVQAYISKCKLSTRSMGLPDDFYDLYLQQTQKNKLQRLKDDVELYSPNGKITDQENAYRWYAKKIGRPEKEIEKYLREQNAISAAAYTKELKSCTAVDLRPGLGPVREQDSVGWCYAFSAADLFSYKLKQRISAADIAFTYNKSFLNDLFRYFGKDESTFSGGIDRVAMDEAQEKGLCLEKDLSSEDNENSMFATLLSDIDRLGRYKIKQPNPDCDMLYDRTKTIFPNVNIEDLQNILSTSSKTNFIDSLVNKTCASRIKTSFKTTRIENNDPQKFGNLIDEQLASQNPLTLSYDANVLYDHNSRPSVYQHSSVIAGRKFNQKTGQCEYLIRNSWGRGCSQYDPNLSCEEGNIWVPKADILKRSADANYLK